MKNLKIKNLDYLSGYCADEIQSCIDSLGKNKDSVIICKIGNKNYTIVSDKTIDDKLVLCLRSVNKQKRKRKKKFNIDSYNTGIDVAINLIDNSRKLNKNQISHLLKKHCKV